MKTKFKLLSKVTFILGFISFVSILYVLYKLNFDLLAVIDKTSIDYPALVGYLFIILFHILALIFLIAHFRYYKSSQVLRIITMIAGIFSLFAIGGEKVLFDEIAREYVLGWEIIGEIIIVQILLFCNLIFCFLTFILIFKTQTDQTIKLEDVWVQS